MAGVANGAARLRCRHAEDLDVVALAGLEVERSEQLEPAVFGQQVQAAALRRRYQPAAAGDRFELVGRRGSAAGCGRCSLRRR